MSKEKQIEEMAETMSHSCEKECRRNKYGEFDCEYCEAELLYNAGYRKQEEGEWIKRNYSCYCSVCGGEHGFAFTTGSAHNYCPNCGARMGGGSE